MNIKNLYKIFLDCITTLDVLNLCIEYSDFITTLDYKNISDDDLEYMFRIQLIINIGNTQPYLLDSPNRQLYDVFRKNNANKIIENLKFNIKRILDLSNISNSQIESYLYSYYKTSLFKNKTTCQTFFDHIKIQKDFLYFLKVFFRNYKYFSQEEFDQVVNGHENSIQFDDIRFTKQATHVIMKNKVDSWKYTDFTCDFAISRIHFDVDYMKNQLLFDKNIIRYIETFFYKNSYLTHHEYIIKILKKLREHHLYVSPIQDFLNKCKQ